MPLQWLLPLLTTGLVVGALVAGLVVLSRVLSATAVDTAQDRLTRGARQLVAVTASGLQVTRTRYESVAHAQPVATLLHSSAPTVSDTVLRALRSLTLPTDSGLPVELWNAAGKRVAFVGNDLGSALALQQRSELEHAAIARAGLDSIRAVDSLQLGSMYGDGGRTYLWLVLPVVEQQHVIGYLAQQRRVAANENTQKTLRELTGSTISAYYRNIDGKYWAGLTGPSVGRPALDDAKTLYTVARIGSSPVELVLTIPRESVLDEPRALIRRLAIYAAALSLIVALLAWLIGRYAARPIVRITGAAEALAHGDYGARVPVRGPDEVARLAISFNEMAGRLGASNTALEHREAEFRALADSIPQLAWMAHADGSIFWFNRRWFEYTGTTLEEMSGWGWQRVHDPGRLNDVMTTWRAALEKGERVSLEFPLRAADGEMRWFLTRVEPVRDRDGNVIRWFGTNTDIQDLREAREAARAASRAKSEFLATMSHELRTPLNAIGGYAELLEMELRGPITEAQRRDLERIKISQQHLLGLISGVLDLSRIESGRVQYDLKHIALDPMLAGLDALVGPQAAAKQLMLAYDGAEPNLAVYADREKLRQIMLNLLSNAIRYTPSGGRITLSAMPFDHDRVEISVTDTGPGIPVERQAAIFEPFVQLDRSITNTVEGVGLGLAISRDLALGMNGELTVASSPGHGARFLLRLPRGDAQQAPIYAATGEMPAQRGALGRVASSE